ncbi:putative Endoplasmic Reticulum-Golgi Intermediate Compartment (ERGIC) [Blattamonas nauphoetae]|uniref:Endoplasmic Reticulum-Golgi Intermediate Compartment (ERGIC) n=1 Tax=Blattamonas nauphoetae TaxID=2049346 RepID=A0ABQ9WVC1_9EUKA|nr:putative Endoplasmic Reticulum-Golgi Intermediate Compartment (ERGIC) [Blattamonas nauphoetae]
MSLTKTLKRFDVYRKLEDEEYARVQTTSGGLLSLGCLLFSITLFINEFVTWRKPEVKHELSVDQSLFDTFDINFDIIIPHIQCRYLQLKVFDKSGMQQQVLSNTLHFHDLDENGTTLRARPLFGLLFSSSIILWCSKRKSN